MGLNRKVLITVIAVVLVAGVGILVNSPEPEEHTVISEPEPFAEIKVYYGLDLVESGDTMTLPTTFMGETTEAFIIIQNTGTLELEVEPSISGSTDFILHESDQIIKSGSGELIHLQYTPTSLGKKDATITVTSSDLNNSEIVFDITGTSEPIDRPDRVIALARSGESSLTWEPVSGAESYNLYWSTDSTLSTPSLVQDITSPFTLDNLTDGSKHYFYLTAVNQFGESKPSDLAWAHPGPTYYVDAEMGDDTNDGTYPQQAWRTYDRVRLHQFQPGDNLLLKAGSLWVNTFEISVNGTESHPITVSQFGEGPNPIITGKSEIENWDNETLWEREGRYWTFYYGPWKRAVRLWLDGVEHVRAQYLVNVSDEYPWYFDNEQKLIYLLSDTNPALKYTSIQESMAFAGSALTVRNVNYQSYRGISFEGGGSAVSVSGANHIEFIDCEIGRYSSSMAMWISGTYKDNDVSPSEHGLVKWCTLDSGYRLQYPYEKAQTEDGIHMRDNVNHWIITGSNIHNWGHSGISMLQNLPDYPVNNNTVSNNHFTSAQVSYGRPWETKGRPGGCSYNVFTGNIVERSNVPIQMGGNYNLVENNIIYGQWPTTVYEDRQGQAIVLTPAMGKNREYVSEHITVRNNVVYNSSSSAIDVQEWYGNIIDSNQVIDNKLIMCGYIDPGEHLGISMNIGNYYDETTSSTNKNTIVIDNTMLTKISAPIRYRGKYYNASTFNGLIEGYGDTLSGNHQIVVSNDFDLTLSQLSFLVE